MSNAQSNVSNFGQNTRITGNKHDIIQTSRGGIGQHPYIYIYIYVHTYIYIYIYICVSYFRACRASAAAPEAAGAAAPAMGDLLLD